MSLPCALHGSPKYCGRWSLNGSLQGRQVSADGLPPQRLCFRRHQVLSRFVVEKDLPVRADCHDSSRTAFDKNIQLLFRFLPTLHLVCQFVRVALECDPSVATKLRNKQPRAHEAGGAKYKVYEPLVLILWQIAEIKTSAQQGNDDNPLARQESSRNHDRKQV